MKWFPLRPLRPSNPEGPTPGRRVLLTLLLAVLVVPIWGDADEARRLEQMAEQSFIDDDLATATALYRRAYHQFDERDEQVRILMAIAWLEHLQNRGSDARQSLVSALVLDPDLRFQPDLYDGRFRSLFIDAQQLAAAERRTLANQRIREGNEQLRARDYAAARGSFQKALELRPDAISALCDNADRRNELGRNARQMIDNRFSRAASLALWEDLLDGLSADASGT